MKSMKFIIVCLTVSVMFFAINREAQSVSTSVKSEKDYIFTLNALRSINIMVDNFADDAGKGKYKEVNKHFREAGEAFYGRSFDESFQKFRKLKFELIDLLDSIAKSYIDRTKLIMDSTQKDAFEILIKYSKKNTNFTSYLRRPFNPLYDVKPYDVQKFHYFYNRVKIEKYIRNGYRNLQDARDLHDDPEIDMLKKRKYLSPSGQNFIINKYLNAIYRCRQAKVLGIAIHKIINVSELGKSLTEFGISARHLDPIFDYRIPDKYKIDANDNIGLIHAVEVRKLEKRKKNSN